MAERAGTAPLHPGSRRIDEPILGAPPDPLGDEVDRRAHRGESLRFFVGDLDAELVFELHDELHQVQAIGVQVILERRFQRDVRGIDAKLVDQDVAHLSEDLVFAHLRLLLRFG